MGKYYHNLVRIRRGQPLQYWTIDVINNRTIVKTKEEGGRFEGEPQEYHVSFGEAKKHAQQLAKRKQREGFIDVRDYKKKKIHEGGRSQASFRTTSQADSDHDTDSVTSSVVSVSDLSPSHRRKPNQSGVSPLNRRRSLRLQAMRKESTMQAFPSLASQNTAEMRTPPQPLERMETSTRWKGYRGETLKLRPQETLVVAKPGPRAASRMSSVAPGAPPVPPGVSKWLQHRSAAREQSSVASLKRSRSGMSKRENSVEDASALLRKKSTTWDLRKMMQCTKLNSVGQAGEISPALDEPDSGESFKTDLSPIPEGPKKKSILNKTGKSMLRKKVTMVTPSEQAPVVQRTKRQASQQDLPGHAAKRLKHSDSLQRGHDVKVFKTSKAMRGSTLEAPVVWCAPLAGESGSEEEGLSVYVDSSRCLIGTMQGTVHELDDTVTPVRRLSLSVSIYQFTQHQSAILAATGDGQVLELSKNPPGVFWKFNEDEKDVSDNNILSICSAGDRVVISDSKGNVSSVTSQSKLLWRKKSEGYFGWMALADDSVTYHGHSAGVTCYDVSGKHVFYTATHAQQPVPSQTPSEAVQCGVMQGESIFVAVGNTVLQIDKATGALTHSFYHVAPHLSHVTAVDVGGGVVFCSSNSSNKIVCCDQEMGDVIYVLTLPPAFKTSAIKYFQARLFCVGNGHLYVIDLTKDSVTKALKSANVEPTVVHLLTASSALQQQTSSTRQQSRLPSTPALKKGKSKTSRPKPRSGRLRVT